MKTTEINVNTRRNKSHVLLRATLTAGILDALAAIVVYYLFFQYKPIQVYQFVASALLGPQAYKGGLPIALLGLFFHFLIAFAASLVFYVASPRIPFLARHDILSGLLYGLLIWLVMNLLVLPLTKIPPAPFDVVAMLAMIWHMLLVGLPISLIVHNNK